MNHSISLKALSFYCRNLSQSVLLPFLLIVVIIFVILIVFVIKYSS